MEIEALRLFKILYDLSASDQIDMAKGIMLERLLNLAKSEYNTASSGRILMSHLIYDLIRACKSHYSFSVKESTFRLRRAEAVILPYKEFEEFCNHISRIRGDLEKCIFITSVIKLSTRTDKLFELLYKKAENFDTYAIYKLIIEAGPNGTTYAQISRKYNRLYGPQKRISSIKIADYCKKVLERNGFIKYLQASNNVVLKPNERLVVLTKHAVKNERKERFKLSGPVLKHKRPLPPGPIEKSKKENAKQIIPSHISDLDRLKKSTERLTMRQIIGRSISSEFAKHNGGLTINEIAYILNMEDNTKAVNRVLEDMRKGNAEIHKSIERTGRITVNKYLLINNDITEVKIDTKTEGHYGMLPDNSGPPGAPTHRYGEVKSEIPINEEEKNTEHDIKSLNTSKEADRLKAENEMLKDALRRIKKIIDE